MNKMLITNAGLAEIVNAEQSGTAPVVLSHVAFGTGQYTATADLTKLKSEFKRFDAVAGGAISDNIIHLTVHDNSADKYTVNEVGVFTASGTLFAVISQTTPIMEKSATSESMLAIDIALTDIDASSITFGDTNLVLNPATTETAGIVELATDAEAKTGTDTTRAMTPAAAKAARDADANIVHCTGNETIGGSKTFTGNLIVSKDSPFVLVSQNDIVKGTTPEASQYMGVAFTDSEGHATANRFGLIETKYLADGSSCLSVSAYKPEKGSTASVAIDLVYPASGTPYVSVPTPAAGDNSTKIATTAWVNTKAANFLPLAGGKMSGSIYKTSDSTRFIVGGGQTYDSGAHIALDGKEYSDGTHAKGSFSVSAHNGTTTKALIGQPDGQLQWGGQNIVRSVNGTAADAAGNVEITTGIENTATGEASLTLLGTAASVECATNVGNSADATAKRATAYGYVAKASGVSSVALGPNTTASGSSAVALGFKAQATANGAVQIGDGTNSVANTMKFGDKYVLNNSFIMPTDSGAIMLTSGSQAVNGAYFRLYGKDHATGAGQFNIAASDGTTSKALAGKADGTLTWDGINMSAMGMPSSKYTDLTLGSGGSSYIAPADGWFYIDKEAGRAGGYVKMYNSTAKMGYTIAGHATTDIITNSVPAKQGDKIVISYTASGTTYDFRFIYAEGAKHLAS